jgi:hypothetical protein
MLLKDAKVGDSIVIEVADLQFSRNGYTAIAPLRCTVIKSSEYGTTVGWKVTEKVNGLSPIFHHYQVAFPELTETIDLVTETKCELIKEKNNQNQLGFLIACLGVGTAMSHFFNQKEADDLSSKEARQ